MWQMLPVAVTKTTEAGKRLVNGISGKFLRGDSASAIGF